MKKDKIGTAEKNKKSNILRRSSFQDRNEIIKKQICGILFKNLQIIDFNDQTSI